MENYTTGIMTTNDFCVILMKRFEKIERNKDHENSICSVIQYGFMEQTLRVLQESCFCVSV